MSSPKNDWATPPDFFQRLNRVFNFNFDPCPLCHDVSKWDGLTIDWKERNFINPPYTRTLKEKFIQKCIEEKKKGNLCVLLIPSYTSTIVFHDVILPNFDYILFLKDRLKFISPHRDVNETKSMFSSMLVVFDGRQKETRAEDISELFDIVSTPFYTIN